MRWFVIALVVSGAACTSAAGAAAPGRLFNRPLHDPRGDALNIFGGPGAPIDLKRLDVVIITGDTSTTVELRMKFYGRIRAPSSAGFGAPEALRARMLNGLVEVGHPVFSVSLPGPAQNQFAPPLPGVILSTRGSFDLFSEAAHPGFVEFREFAPNGGIVQEFTLCPIVYRTRSARTSVELLGFSSAGDLPTHFAAMFGNYFGPNDAPDETGNVRIIVPAPGGAMVVGIGGLLVQRRWRNRRMRFGSVDAAANESARFSGSVYIALRAAPASE